MTAPSTPIHQLSPTEREVVQALLARFAQAWQDGSGPRIDDYLQQPVQHVALLVELVQLDLAQRSCAGEPAGIDSYLERYPELLEFRLFLSAPRQAALTLTGQTAGAPAATLPPAAAASGPQLTPATDDGTAAVLVPGLRDPGRVGPRRHGRRLQGPASPAQPHRGAQDGPGRRPCRQRGAQRFLAEAEAVAALQHPNIVQVFEFGQHDGLPYMALEYVNGGSLADRLRDGLPCPREAAWLVEQLARGMAAAHAKGIIHRDLKPHNVLLRRKSEIENPTCRKEQTAGCGSRIADLEPKVTDFGLAKTVEGGSGLTQTGAVDGHAELHGSGASRGQEGHRAGGGRLCAGSDPVRVPDGPAAVSWRDADGHACMQVVMDEPVRPAPAERPDAARSGDHLPEMSGQGAVQALRQRAGPGGGPAAFPGGRADSRAPGPHCRRLAKWVRRRPVVAALLAAVLLVTVAGIAGSVWDLETGKEICNFGKNPRKGAGTPIMSGNGKRVFLTGPDQSISVWDVDAGKEIRVFRGPAGC